MQYAHVAMCVRRRYVVYVHVCVCVFYKVQGELVKHNVIFLYANSRRKII